MRTVRALVLGLIAAASPALVPAPARADETPVKSKIVAVDLFKNGLVVVKSEVVLGKAGTYVLDDVPQPVHGTFWVESAVPLEAVVKLRDVEVPAGDTPPGDLQEDLAGRLVTIHFKGDKRPPLTGTMMKFKPVKAADGFVHGQPGRFVVLQTRTGRTYIEAAEISSVDAENAGEKVKRSLPRLLLTLGATDKAETKVTVRYLSRGMAWAPSYKLDISDPKMLSLEQHAVVKNELTDLAGADVRLISGFPSVQFSHVRSPLSPRTSLAAFFQELGGGGGRDNDFTANAMSQQGFLNNSVGNFRAGGFDLALGATPTGEGVDLHFQPIGKRTLADGEALALTVAKGQTPYERIVEWLIPDTRNEYGQYAGAQGRGNDRGDEADDTAWDALKFKNPLPFPMTTGPATVTADGTFNGQRTSYWVNAGEETVLRVNKALSVRTRATENEALKKENGDDRVFLWVGPRQYRRSTVEGEVAVGNHRKETIQLVVRRRFSGDLISADGSPKSSLREEGVFSVNKRNELLWTLTLKGGEERKLKYTYTVLVAH
ncbi:DUF4139 domain-containing protein [Fimbriiglobus ruber]|uniref:DUF4139 domain-containing protein n=1 Tax=Fimbriiglobus ruber TaxID=1908690 RepID=A0A225DTG0_9BACT|nr:DUF4139 domain-containing protein [Fimbriiglobus ruber]OWK40866.1 hypothetical protein FRUB_04758 [Fimbriiglobus ruber]